eukprot:3741783-Karenia_brevis.AAC.1
MSWAHSRKRSGSRSKQFWSCACGCNTNKMEWKHCNKCWEPKPVQSSVSTPPWKRATDLDPRAQQLTSQRTKLYTILNSLKNME